MNAARMVGFCEAIKLGFKNYVNFEGRSRRSEYWFFILFLNIITIVTFTLMMVFGCVPKKVPEEKRQKRYYRNYNSNYYNSYSYNSNYSYSNYYGSDYSDYYYDYYYDYYDNEFWAFLSIFLIYHSAIIIPYFSATARRLHDIGKNGNYVLMLAVPPFGWIALIVLLCLDSDKMANKYGASTKYFDINQITPLSNDINLPKGTFPVPASSVDIR